MAKTQLEVNIGANNQKAKQKIAEVKKDGIDAVQEIQNKHRESIKGMLGMVAPIGLAMKGISMLVAGIGNSIKKYFAQGEVFTKWAEKANVSAHSPTEIYPSPTLRKLISQNFYQNTRKN